MRKPGSENKTFRMHVLPLAHEVILMSAEKRKRRKGTMHCKKSLRNETYRELQAVENDHMVIKQKYRTIA